MKRILFIVALLPFLVKAQSINNQKVRWMQPIYMGSNTASTVNSSSDTSAFFFDRADSVLYFKYKGAARAIGYAGSIPNVGQQITDSLKALVRLRAIGSVGIDVQNSSGTSVANFGSGGSTNISLNGSTNVNARLSVTDSIVGVNQRLSGGLSVGGFNVAVNNGGTATYVPLWGSSNRLSNSSIYQDPLGAAIGINQTTNLTSLLNVAGTIKNQGIYFDTSSAASNPSLGMLVYTTANNKLFFKGPSGFAANISTGSLTADREFTFPNTTGTIALTSNLSSYLPLTGGTLSGNLTLNGGDLQINTRRYIYLGNTANSLFPYIRNTDGDGIGIYNNAGSALLEATTANGITTNSRAFVANGQGNNIAISVDSSVTSTTYTLVLGDAGYLKRCSNASAITITVPTNASVAFPIGTTIYFSQQGAGKVSVSPATSDVTIHSEGNLLGTAGQHAVIGLIKVNTNRWLLVGNRG